MHHASVPALRINAPCIDLGRGSSWENCNLDVEYIPARAVKTAKSEWWLDWECRDVPIISTGCFRAYINAGNQFTSEPLLNHIFEMVPYLYSTGTTASTCHQTSPYRYRARLDWSDDLISHFQSSPRARLDCWSQFQWEINTAPPWLRHLFIIK